MSSSGAWRIGLLVLLTSLSGVLSAQEPAATSPPLEVRSLTFSPDGKWLAIAAGQQDQGGEVSLWRTSDWSRQATRQTVPATKLTFSPAEPTRLACLTKPSVLLLSVPELDTLGEGLAAASNVTDMAWAPDGRSLLTAGLPAEIHRWDVRTGERIQTYQAPEAEEGVFRPTRPRPYSVITVLPNTGTFLAGGSGPNASVWELRSGEVLHTFDDDQSMGAHLVMSAVDGGVCAVATRLEIRCSVYDAESFALMASVRVRSSRGALSPSGEILALLDRDGALRAWRLELDSPDEQTAARIQHLIDQCGDDDVKIREAAFEEMISLGLPASQALKEAMETSPDAEVRLRSRRALIAIRSPDPVFEPSPDDGRTTALAFPPDGTMLLTGDNRGNVRFWDTTTWAQVRMLTISGR